MRHSICSGTPISRQVSPASPAASRQVSEVFCLGSLVGAASIMFVMCIFAMFISDNPKGAIVKLSEEYYALFRGLFLLVFFFVCYGVDLLIWDIYAVDFKSIFKVPMKHTYWYVIKHSALLMLVMSSAFVLYVFALTKQITLQIGGLGADSWPLFAVGCFVVAVVIPSRAKVNQRWLLVRTILICLVSPLSETNFARNFVADIFCSMPRVFLDASYTVCIYATGEAFMDFSQGSRGRACSEHRESYYVAKVILSLLPFWVRFWQCVRSFIDSGRKKHIFNGLKYCSSITVIFLSLTDYTKTWFAMAIFSTCFSYTWDILQDWGLGPDRIRSFLHGETFGRTPKWPLTRPVCIYPRWVYIFIPLTNLVARCGWAIVISPGQKVLKNHLVLLLGCVELLRRAQWSILRVEWEYVHHTFGAAPKHHIDIEPASFA
mmetsp:Transcript_82879/g.130316  ORF Transcript_82879/g.130316 Transcript_82879/m.130316 type:complete len:432 (-) Transcript_82879:29-1324(-)